MGNPFFNNAKNQTWQQFKKRQTPLEPGKDAHSLITENIRREPDEAVVQTIPAPVYANKAPTSTPIIYPTAAGNDRWHKYSDFRITVSNQHKATSDTVLDSDAFHTITDAITAAKTWFTALSLIYTNPIIEIEVHGGHYDEQIIIDVSYLRFQGIGMPQILTSAFLTNDGTVSITSDCTKVLFDGFEIITNGGLEGSNWYDSTGVRIHEGAESGSRRSDIWFRNCWFHGTGTQVYSERWSYFQDCHSISEDNHDNPFSYASVVWRICTDGVNTPYKWSVWEGGSISGQITSDPIKKGQAFAIIGMRSDLRTWVPNTYSIGSVYLWSDISNPATIATEPWRSNTGVRIAFATITGGAENIGWALEYFHNEIIGGFFVNNTGSGNVHLKLITHTHTASETDVNAYVWFTGGVGKVNYLVNPFDNSLAMAAIATGQVWINNFKHSAPVGPYHGGSVVFGVLPAAGTPAPNTNVQTAGSFSTKQFWLNNGPPFPAGSSNTNYGSVSDMLPYMMLEGYLDV